MKKVEKELDDRARVVAKVYYNHEVVGRQVGQACRVVTSRSGIANEATLKVVANLVRRGLV